MRALVVDDSKPVRSILGRMLGELGFDVHLSCHGQDALEQLDQGPRPDIVTVNWNMPVMDGAAFLRAVREDGRYQDLKVIMISVEARPDKISEAKQLGADDYLIKPLDEATLTETLQRLGLNLPAPDSEGAEAASAARKDVEAEPRTSPAPKSSAVRRVMVVDDAVVIRRTLSAVLNEDPEIEVVAAAADGRIALDLLEQSAPDVVLLDVEMPNMNGLDALRELRKTHPRLPVIMFSSLTERGAEATLEALMHGANDYVPKPAGVSSLDVAKQCIVEELIPRIKQLTPQSPQVTATALKPGRPLTRRPYGRVDVVVIGISTGGPVALATLLPQFLPQCPVPVAIVQHMPPLFTRHLASRLSDHGRLDVFEGEVGAVLRPRQAVIAPGGQHMTLEREGKELIVELNQDPPENSCRPAADVLFRSAAKVCKAATLAVVMTGMGKDGERGCRAIVDAGGGVLVQDAQTSVVWGMPGQVVQAGLAEEVLSLDRLGDAILERTNAGRKRI